MALYSTDTSVPPIPDTTPIDHKLIIVDIHLQKYSPE